MYRSLSLDLAKGFTVAFIPAIHCVMVYSAGEVHENLFVKVLRLIAEWPGAQLLLFIMGMCHSFSKKHMGYQVSRALLLWCGGYVLNFVKFVVPYWCDVLPQAFLDDLQFSHGTNNSLQLLLLGDILQAAGLCSLVLCLLKRLKYYALYAVLLCYIVTLCSPFFWDLHADGLLPDHLLHLIGGTIDECFFPLFPWLVYPLVGLAIGNYLQFPWASVKAIAAAGLFLLASGAAMPLVPFHFPDALFWRTYPDGTIMHLGFVMAWLGGWIWLEPKAKRLLMRKQHFYSTWYQDVLVRCTRFFCFCSRHITLIYVVQWVVIFWLLPLMGYRVLGTVSTLLVIVLVNLLVFGLVYLIKRRRRLNGVKNFDRHSE